MVGKIYGSRIRIGYHGNILLRINSTENQWEGGVAETKSLIMQGVWRGQERKLNFGACSARIVSKWVVVA